MSDKINKYLMLLNFLNDWLTVSGAIESTIELFNRRGW